MGKHSHASAYIVHNIFQTQRTKFTDGLFKHNFTCQSNDSQVVLGSTDDINDGFIWHYPCARHAIPPLLKIITVSFLWFAPCSHHNTNTSLDRNCPFHRTRLWHDKWHIRECLEVLVECSKQRLHNPMHMVSSQRFVWSGVSSGLQHSLPTAACQTFAEAKSTVPTGRLAKLPPPKKGGYSKKIRGFQCKKQKTSNTNH